MTVTSPGHYQRECRPHSLALAVKVIFGHLIQSLVRVLHLSVYLLSESEGLLKCSHHQYRNYHVFLFIPEMRRILFYEHVQRSPR